MSNSALNWQDNQDGIILYKEIIEKAFNADEFISEQPAYAFSMINAHYAVTKDSESTIDLLFFFLKHATECGMTYKMDDEYYTNLEYAFDTAMNLISEGDADIQEKYLPDLHDLVDYANRHIEEAEITQNNNQD
jgi:hypothetical protein